MTMTTNLCHETTRLQDNKTTRLRNYEKEADAARIIMLQRRSVILRFFWEFNGGALFKNYYVLLDFTTINYDFDAFIFTSVSITQKYTLRGL